MPDSNERFNEAFDQVRRIKAGRALILVGDDVEERPWSEAAEEKRLALLRSGVDWSGISERQQAFVILLSVDPDKLQDAERRRLVAAACGPVRRRAEKFEAVEQTVSSG